MKHPITDDPVPTRIQDMPLSQRPREKLASCGPTALDNAELLALFISTGTRGSSAIDIGRRLLARHGGIHALGSLSVAELSREHGMGIAKAAKLAAVFELGARAAREQLHTVPLDAPEVIYEYFEPQLRHQPQEHLLLATLDTRLCLTSTSTISVGSINSTTAHPREILRPVITRSAYGFILIHNHPSGDPTPSKADISTTQRIAEAAELFQVVLVDHLIIGRPTQGRLPYYSFHQAGLIRRVASTA